jgi:hypothetical protein
LSTWFEEAARALLLEPGDTSRQWKGEAAAGFVRAGIISSRALPTSSAGYWFPFLSLIFLPYLGFLDETQAPPKRRLPSGVILLRV